MERLLHIALLIITVNTITGCANSASHEVLKPTSSIDDMLGCDEIRSEIRKAGLVIEGVEQDKRDMTGTDMVDGLLWFPFNVIAKQSNYSQATKVAQSRIDNLVILQHVKGCGEQADI